MNVTGVLDAAIPLAAGIAVTILGFSRRRDVDGDSKLRLVRRIRWLGPALLALSLWRFDIALSANPPGIRAQDIAAALRKRLAPPSMMDEVTRVDAVEAVGQHVLVRATITRPPPTQSGREAFLEQQFRQMRIKFCRTEPSRSWLQQGIGFEYEYSMDGKAYSPAIIVQKDCE